MGDTLSLMASNFSYSYLLAVCLFLDVPDGALPAIAYIFYIHRDYWGFIFTSFYLSPGTLGTMHMLYSGFLLDITYHLHHILLHSTRSMFLGFSYIIMTCHYIWYICGGIQDQGSYVFCCSLLSAPPDNYFIVALLATSRCGLNRSKCGFNFYNGWVACNVLSLIQMVSAQHTVFQISCTIWFSYYICQKLMFYAIYIAVAFKEMVFLLCCILVIICQYR